MTRVLVVAVVLATMPPPAAAQQTGGTEDRRLVISATALAGGLTLTQPAPRDRRDSIANGLIIGAVVGAVALGGFGAWICHMTHEPGTSPCGPDVAKIALIGAAIGGGAGAGIDALLARSPAASPFGRGLTIRPHPVVR